MVNGILDDVRFMTEEGEELLEDCDNEDEILTLRIFYMYQKMNMDIPLHMLDLLQDIIFQAYGADHIYLFFNKELRKTVICFEYT